MHIGVRKRIKLSLLSETENKCKDKQDIFDECLLNYIIYNMKPFKTVDDPHFIKLINGTNFIIKNNHVQIININIYEFKVLDNKIKIMSRRSLGRKVEDKYLDLIEELKEKFKSIKYFTSTADIWSTKHRSFMGVTLHYVRFDNFYIIFSTPQR